ncbi:MAG: protein-disulfide reductase DsbD family protein [Mariniblastus sp.]|nr:protein-disulfide reductase DsbD family protein [Mariniblastus sp.]
MHLQSGTNRGYLVLRVDLMKGSHIYSLTQKGEIRPTTISVAKSPRFRLLGGFVADRVAEVTKHDPVFNQRVEKHKNQVQFFVPIELAPGAELADISAEVSINGQVCTSQNICMPILGETVKGRFAGYFERSAKKQNSLSSSESSSKIPNRQYR